MQGFYWFSLKGVPVRVSGWYLLLAAYYAYGLRNQGPGAMVGFLVALTLSLLIHEFGHALVARKYALSPSILLHGFGGLTSHQKSGGQKEAALIIAAGPLAGIATWGILSLVVPFISLSHEGMGLLLRYFFQYMLFINLWWSIFNLLPLYPLDGGQLFQLGVEKALKSKPQKLRSQIVHGTGIGLSLLIALWGLQMGSMLMAIIGGMLLYINWGHAKGGGASRSYQSQNAMAEALLREGYQVLSKGDAREARRLAYQAREEDGLSKDQVQGSFRLLALSSYELSEDEDVLYWVRSSEASPLMKELEVKSLLRLSRLSEAEALLLEPYAFSKDAYEALRAELRRRQTLGEN